MKQHGTGSCTTGDFTVTLINMRKAPSHTHLKALTWDIISRIGVHVRPCIYTRSNQHQHPRPTHLYMGCCPCPCIFLQLLWLHTCTTCRPQGSTATAGSPRRRWPAAGPRRGRQPASRDRRPGMRAAPRVPGAPPAGHRRPAVPAPAARCLRAEQQYSNMSCGWFTKGLE